jgi:hypothetical protein
MKKSSAKLDEPASELISQRIAELGDWRGQTLGRRAPPAGRAWLNSQARASEEEYQLNLTPRPLQPA